MTPLDDELRRTLRAQAGTLAPSADPLAGIEQRARRIRRRRSLAAVGTAAAAAAVVAIAVPAVVNGIGPAPRQVTSPSTSPMASASTTPPVDPTTWRYRGNAVEPSTLDAFRREFEVRHPGSTFVPLFGQVYEPSGQQELVFASKGPDENSGWRAGVVQSGEPGPEFVYDEGRSWLSALAFVLPGDEGARLLVVADPGSSGLSATSDVGTLPFTPLTELAPGVATGPVPEQRPGLMVRLTLPDGSQDDGEPYDRLAVPTNVLDWPARGDASAGPSVHDLEVAFTRENQSAEGRVVHYRPLFTGDTDSGVRFTLGQAWFEGDKAATTVLYSVSGSERGVLRQYRPSEDPTVVAGLLTDLPGTSVDLLVVVPTPGTGQVSYDDDATGSFRPVTGQDHLDGVVLVDRAKGATDDRLEVLDGDGDLDRPLYRGPVADLLPPVR